MKDVRYKGLLWNQTLVTIAAAVLAFLLVLFLIGFFIVHSK